jgi:hypothetical protein
MSDAERPHNPRLEHLSVSDSGLHYVREKKSGVLRRLTDSELNDFDDPPPCEQCGEQFGCEHFNCAREPLMSETEVDVDVPEQCAFARAAGLPQRFGRLAKIEHRDGEYHPTPNADMRMQELVCCSMENS